MDTDDPDEFDLQNSVAPLHPPPNQDLALLWDDLPLSSLPGSCPTISAQYDSHSTLLNDHDIPEYFLDSEGEWTQDGRGGWCWRTFEPLLYLDSDAEDRFGPSTSNDEDFPLVDPSQGLLLTSQTQFNCKSDVVDSCHQQIGAETLDPDQDLNCEAESQDYGAESIVPNTTNTSEYPPLLDHSTSSNPTCSQEQPSNPIAKRQHPFSQSNHWINYDTHSDSDSNSDILYDFNSDVPEILSDLPPFADEII